MKRFIGLLIIMALVIVGAVEFTHRQLLNPWERPTEPSDEQVVRQQKAPTLKAPGDASRMSRQIITSKPIKYHGFFDSKNQSTYLQQVRSDALKDINQERAKRHLKPLKLKHSLNRVAAVRAVQADQHFSHYDQAGQALGCIDAVKLKIAPSYLQARAHLSECLSEQAGDIDNTAKQVAHTAVSGMIYHDAGSDWGHRKILLDPKNDYVGITAHYDKAGDNKVVVAYDLFQP